MKNIYTKGFAPYLVVIILAIIIGGGAVYFSDKDNGEAMMEDEHEAMEESMMEEGEAMMKGETGDTMMQVPAPGHEGVDEMMVHDEDAMMMESISFSGKLLAGSKSHAPLLDFNKADYDKAIASDKLVALYFYANWCPVCRVEFPKMESVFDELDTDQVVGFRVNYNDNQTDDNEKALARQFGVAYQHTKVFLKDGERVLKSPEGWGKDRYLEEITRFIK